MKITLVAAIASNNVIGKEILYLGVFLKILKDLNK